MHQRLANAAEYDTITRFVHSYERDFERMFRWVGVSGLEALERIKPA